MKHKPHIRLEDGIWRGYPRREARQCVIQGRNWIKFRERMQKRFDQLQRAAQDRAAGRATRGEVAR